MIPAASKPPEAGPSTWWVVQRPGQPPIFWEHAAKDASGSVRDEARDILNVRVLHPSIRMGRPVKLPEKLIPAGITRYGKKFYIAGQL